MAVPGAVADEPRPPVFFQKPDRASAIQIAEALKDIARQQLSPRTRGRESLIDVGYWAVDPLVRLLRTGDAVEVRNAALALGELGDRRAEDGLLDVAANDNHNFVGGFAALMLGRFSDPALIPRLDALIRDNSKDDRRISALLAVTKIRAPAAFDILIRTVRTAKLSLVRETAIFCLGFFPDQALVSGADGKVPVRELLAGYHSSETAIRRAAMLAIALLGHRDLKPLYLRSLGNSSEDPDVRRTALLALGRFPDQDVSDVALGLLVDKRAPEKLRVMAAYVLKDRRDPAVLARLKALPPPLDHKLRAAVTLALSNFEDPEVLRILVNRLNDTKDQVRAAAAIGLSRLTTPELKKKAIQALTLALQGALGSLDPDVLHNMTVARDLLQNGKADGAFVWLGNEEFAGDLPKDLEEKLLDLVNDEAKQVLGLNSLSDLKAAKGHQRVNDRDQNSELRDLDEHLALHPYFVPLDLPRPKLTITPRDQNVLGPDAPKPAEGGRKNR
jgi:HEAT repeat protein